MTRTSLRALLSKLRMNTLSPGRKKDEATPSAGDRSFANGCRSVALALIVATGAWNGCPPPKVPNFTFAPRNLTFAPQVLDPAGKASAPQEVVLKSTGSAPLPINSITASGDYSQSNDCPSSLDVGASCTIQVSFAPNAIGVINGSITLDAYRNTVSLSGTGIPPVSLSPPVLDFGTIAPGTTSDPQSVTLTNNQSSAVNISSIAISGNYAQTNNCPASLTAGQSCTIQATFTPTASGVLPGALAVVSDAPLGVPPVELAGTGSGSVSPKLSFSPSSLAFANQEAGTPSAAQPITVTNTDPVSSVTINNVNSSGASYLENDNCAGQVLPPGGTCTIQVAFQPFANLAPLSYPGAITVSNSDSTSPNVVGLSGTGVAPVNGAPEPVDFGTVFGGAYSVPHTVTLTNNDAGAQDLSFSNGPDFLVSNSTCGSSLPAGGQCRFDVQTKSGISGVIRDGLSVTPSGGNFLRPHVISLTACGTALAITPPSFNFGSVPVGTSSDPQTVTITNGGSSTVNIADISLAGSNAGEFSISENTCGQTLASGASCIIKSVFAPQSTDVKAASINLSDDAQCSPQQIALSGGSGAGPFTVTAFVTGDGSGGLVTSDVPGINCGPNGYGTCSAQFASGSMVTLTATPDPGVPFGGWFGACSGTGSCVLDMAADKQVIAVFGANPFLEVGLAGNGSGTVSSSPAGIDCGSTCSAAFAPETVVTLTATPAAGSSFAGWTGVCTGTRPCVTTVMVNESVAANFTTPDFSVDNNGTSPPTIAAGQSASSTVTVTSLFDFSNAVSFTCSVTPALADAPQCSPLEITPPSNNSGQGTLTITTTAPKQAGVTPGGMGPGAIFALALPAAGLALVGIRRGSPYTRSRRLVLMVLSCVLFAGLVFQVACGGGGSNSGGGGPTGGTPAGTYTITLTGTSGSLRHDTILTLNVR